MKFPRMTPSTKFYSGLSIVTAISLGIYSIGRLGINSSMGSAVTYGLSLLVLIFLVLIGIASMAFNQSEWNPENYLLEIRPKLLRICLSISILISLSLISFLILPVDEFTSIVFLTISMLPLIDIGLFYVNLRGNRG